MENYVIMRLVLEIIRGDSMGRHHLLKMCEVLEDLLELAYDGVVITDEKSNITYISNRYCEFLGVSRSKCLDKPVNEIIENTRIPKVISSKKAEFAKLHKLKDKIMVATRIPIIKDDEVTGAIGYVNFKDVYDFHSLYDKISKMEKELEICKGKLNENNKTSYTLDEIIGESNGINLTKEIANKAATTKSNVLLIGESGTGKELFAHAIHDLSERSKYPFVKVNCAAIPRELLESELFGYDKGAFTGANKEGKIGKFELANKGTIFLDEIGDMPLYMQVKLLRVIQEKEVERVGGTKPIRLDVRIIAATNKELGTMVKEHNFRKDLYYRLNVMTINIPPLRERKEDISILARFFIEKLSSDLNKKIRGVNKDVWKLLQEYSWPGNVRELQNIIERALNLVDDFEVLGKEHFPKELIGYKLNGNIKSLELTIQEAEKNAVKEALIICKGNKTKVAKLLKISRVTLYEKITKYKL